MSLQRIHDKVKASMTAIFNFLQNIIVYGISKATRRPKILCKRSKNLKVCTVVNKKMTAKKLRSEKKKPAQVWIIRKEIIKSEITLFFFNLISARVQALGMWVEILLPGFCQRVGIKEEKRKHRERNKRTALREFCGGPTVSTLTSVHKKASHLVCRETSETTSELVKTYFQW